MTRMHVRSESDRRSGLQNEPDHTTVEWTCFAAVSPGMAMLGEDGRCSAAQAHNQNASWSGIVKTWKERESLREATCWYNHRT